MPYSELSDLPKSVQEHLPKHAQEIDRAAYNSAWDEYGQDEASANAFSMRLNSLSNSALRCTHLRSSAELCRPWRTSLAPLQASRQAANCSGNTLRRRQNSPNSCSFKAALSTTKWNLSWLLRRSVPAVGFATTAPVLRCCLIRQL